MHAVLRHPVGAQRAFIRLAVFLGDSGNIKGAPGNTVAAADAVLLVKVHDAVAVLHDRTRRGARLETAWISAVHAAILADQPFELALLHLHFRETHHGPGLIGEVERVVVDAVIGADLIAQVVPLHASHLAGLAADALRDVDELRGLLRLAHPRRRRGSGRTGRDVE